MRRVSPGLLGAATAVVLLAFSGPALAQPGFPEPDFDFESCAELVPQRVLGRIEHVPTRRIKRIILRVSRCARAQVTYQVVTPRGFYWNISKFPDQANPGAVTTNLLRGRYEPNDNGEIDVFFTKQVSLPGFPSAGTPVAPLAELAETGLLDDFRIPFGPPGNDDEFPSGELRTVYIDDDLRIIRGDQVGPQALPTLYVLTRSPTVAPAGYAPFELFGE